MAVVLLFLSAAANSEAHCQYLSTRQRGRDFPIPLLTLTFLQNISVSGLQPLCAQLYLYTVPCPGEPKAGPSLGPVHAEHGKNHFPQPAGCALAVAAWSGAGSCPWKGTLLAEAQLPIKE